VPYFSDGPSDQVHQEVNRGDASHHRQQHFPSGQSKEEQAGGERIAPTSHVDIHIAKMLKTAPGAPRRRDRRQIAVIEPRSAPAMARRLAGSIGLTSAAPALDNGN